MRKLFGALTLRMSLVALGAADAQAYCVHFTNYCDCLDVNSVRDSVNGVQITRLVGTWVNQDCGGVGTNSAMQGQNANGRLSFTGELNPLLAMPGVNWNFTWIQGGSVFDIDRWDLGVAEKWIDESPYVIERRPCTAQCGFWLKKEGLPPSSAK